MKTWNTAGDCSIIMPLDDDSTRGMQRNSSTVATAMTNGTMTTTTTRSPRRRSLSLAEPQPSVETVIVKAKRAAQSLWMLLHAQSCTLGQRCPHTGCQEAKLLHLHLKTCGSNAANNGECPMMYHGCDQSRKLLAHYRRCRTLRARLPAGSNTGTTNGNTGSKQQSSLSHHCLVCSLVARQARTMLEQRTSPPPTTTTNGMNVFKSSSTNVKRSSSVTTRQKMTYSTAMTANDKTASLLNGRNGYNSNNNDNHSPATMPPPPPRTMNMTATNSNSNSSNIDSLARLYATAKQLDTVSSSSDDNDNSDVTDSNHHTDNIYPVVRRERSVSDTELFHCKTTTTSPAIPANYTNSKHLDYSPNESAMMMVDNDDDDSNLGDNINNFSLKRQQQRLRSASCGSGAAAATTTIPMNRNQSAAAVSLSPSHHYCETIVEEET